MEDAVLRCSTCREEKPEAEFTSSRNTATGRHNQCRICLYASRRSFFARDPRATARWWQTYKSKLRADIFAAYGNACRCCGEAVPEFLTIDHVNGRKPGDERLTGDKLWSHVRRLGFPPEFAVLCFNCNCAKGFYGECPHETARKRFALEVVA